MATLDQLMADMGLSDVAPQGQTKTASAQKPSSQEVNEVLENLGLNSDAIEMASEVTKVAGDERNNTMSLESIYGQMFGNETQETVTSTEQVEKTATATEEVNTEDSAFASLAGVYFSEMAGSMMDKVAADLESEAGAGHNPLPEQTGGQLTSVIGKAKDPHMAVNHKPDAGQKLETKGNTSPYTLAAVQQYLKRIGGKEMLIGAQK